MSFRSRVSRDLTIFEERIHRTAQLSIVLQLSFAQSSHTHLSLILFNGMYNVRKQGFSAQPLQRYYTKNLK
uniref:Ovule protein n=1 Tax=Ascaris lumbricoides TaxID=6252 RepID=A0A0M3IM53_ASCLU